MARYSSRRDPVKSSWLFPPTEMGHLCFPPMAYPTNCGPGSEWKCFCGNVWLSEGRQLVSDYPEGATRNDVLIGPERWLPHPTLCHPQHDEVGLYDWRPLGPYYVRLARRIIEQLGGRWDDITD